jgi:hypothetical protein
MVVNDSPLNRRLVHVCADAGLGATLAPLAGQAGLAYLRFDHAFAACLELLRGHDAPAALLVALDGLARVEADLLTWARSRWADLPIWVHGSTARLNGHLAAGRVKLIQLDDLANLLATLSGPQGQVAESQRELPLQPAVAQEEFVEPGPSREQPDGQNGLASSQPVTDSWGDPLAPDTDLACEEASGEVNASFSENPERAELIPASGQTDESLSEIPDRAEPVAATKVFSPPLRLRPADPADRAVLTPEELAALLGPEGIHGG